MLIKPIKNQIGFTLIEIIAVLVIMGILTVFTISRFTSSASDLAAIEAAFKNHIRYAQSKAMFSDDRLWGVRIDTTADDYWLIEAEEGPLSWPGTRIQPMGGSAGDTGYNDDRIRTSLINVDIGSITGGETQVTLLFDNMGVPFISSGSGGITIAPTLADSSGINRAGSDISIPLSDDQGNSRTITITQETGFIP